ncbi:Tex family protein [Neptuniibacter sp. QD48_55]|uniref:Tex family protein n=1 Tax=Neptuniibacter sp. QD48_55 TaxID=3398212 RepID=UPI0039F5C148
MELNNQIAKELGIKAQQVKATIELLDSGSTVPFIARYRKEATGALDDAQLRQLAARLDYLRALVARKQTITEKLQQDGVLTPALHQQINQINSKTELEELYQPFKSKRKTKAQIAIDAGLGKLLDQIIQKPDQQPYALAKAFICSDKGFSSKDECLEGAQAILTDRLVTDLKLQAELKLRVWNEAKLKVSVSKGKESEGSKFRDYFAHSEAIKSIPSHRMLAILRGINEGILKSALDMDENRFKTFLSKMTGLPHYGPSGKWLTQAVHTAWQSRIKSKLTKDLIAKQKDSAEAEAIKVFSRNLHDLLLAAPAGAKTSLGLDPGLRTGVKVAVIDPTGRLLEHTTIYPHPPKNQWEQAIDKLFKLCKRHNVELISIGNGTGSRETDKLVTEMFKQHDSINAQKLIVSEAGASVYSASELATKEFPDLDVSIRGAVSIARRLQDPLAELVKIEPKAIGVGQYQHDVNQSELNHALEAVIEDCVNAVGVDLNSASPAILSRISGLNTTLANNIVAYRDDNGAFTSRTQLKKVARLGPKAYEQAAAFLRIQNGKQVLDNSCVHPEAYSAAQRIAQENQRSLGSIIGDSDFLQSLNPQDYTDSTFGLYTIKDIIKELEKPARDPRPDFKTATLQDGIESVSDLIEGMVLEGTVTNVTNFGAFVDVGVHQDGLVHISQLANRFVKDPHDVVKPGQIVSVKVLEVDLKRKRISLSMRTE